MSENIFAIPERRGDTELFTPLATARKFRVERIVSWGNVTPDGAWYDQDQDEWVTVLQGEGVLEYEDGVLTTLAVGDAALIPAHVRHRVVRTSVTPPCIWLAVHGAGADPAP